LEIEIPLQVFFFVVLLVVLAWPERKAGVFNVRFCALATKGNNISIDNVFFTLWGEYTSLPNENDNYFLILFS
jgi:hypothetical protein